MKSRANKDTLRISVSEEKGVRYLHFGTEWVQGAMRVRKPWALELDYSRHMMAWLLFVEQAPNVLQIGLGAGSLTKFVHRFLPASSVTVVDNSELVLAAARSQFRLPAEDDRLEVVIADGHEYVANPALRGHFSVVQIDVFDQHAQGPVLDSLEFYTACAQALAPGGVATVNLFGEVPSYARNYERIREAFDGRVLLLPPIEAGNVIAICFAPEQGRAPTSLTSWARLRERASVIEDEFGLNAHGWINGLKQSAERDLGSRELIVD